MAYALHEVDEETDVGAYQAYLGAQSNSDLLDIVQHLDADRYPARLDAARREFRRRHMVSLPGYTSSEYALRYAALFALALSAVTLILTLMMTSGEAAGPAWPEGIPEGAVATRVARLFLVAILRGAVVGSVHLGLYALNCAVLGYWVVIGGARLRRRRARADVWQLTTASCVLLFIAMLFAAGPGSAVPNLFTSGSNEPRAVTLLNPFG